MTITNILYTLLIGPLELFFEIIFSIAYGPTENPGLAIIILSLCMNFLLLPLYKMADEIQAEEIAKENKLKAGVAHIKKIFRGDERFMMLQTYYRQNNYKITDPLKGSVSLLLEIPFFIAAYNFLSTLPLLQGRHFGPISDLAVPDHIFICCGVAINVLPILMTVINLISSAIYTKGASARTKIQLFLMAGLFLVLLYNSPSGLVLYWTLNNLFSLVKNLFVKLKNPKKVFFCLLSVVGLGLLAFALITHPMPTRRSQILLCCLLLLLQLPLVLHIIAAHRIENRKGLCAPAHSCKVFLSACLFLTVLCGLIIPVSVIQTSPEEFINTAAGASPLLYVFKTLLTASGFFLVWASVFYMLTNNQAKGWLDYGALSLAVCAVINYLFFGRGYGNMSANLVFDNAPVYSHKALNLLILLLTCVIIYLIWRKKAQFLRSTLLIISAISIVTSTVGMVSIQKTVSNKSEELAQTPDELPSIHLSRDGRNVMVLMMDRAIGAYIPYLMNEKPQLRQQLEGFTYYPNTLSFGPSTMFAAPALFGGYEYTPEKINHRENESLEEKHNEALKVMPRIFDDAGFEVTVFDPPWAGYDVIPDLSIYDEYPDIRAFNSRGKFNKNSFSQQMNEHKLRNRNMFMYSVFKMAPTALQTYIYNKGNYHDTKLSTGQTITSLYSAQGMRNTFMDAYTVLENLPNITTVQDQGPDVFLMLTNDTTHEPSMLQQPGYEPAEEIDNTKYITTHSDLYNLDGKQLYLDQIPQMTHYHANMAAFLKLGEWFDYLREENVFDNTRIIIVSDHGFGTQQFDNVMTDTEVSTDIIFYNPVLLVKDFDSHKEFSADNTFMTNADTPTLATQELIEDAVNPFSGKPLFDPNAKSEPQTIISSSIANVNMHKGSRFAESNWYSVRPENLLDIHNWAYLGFH